MKTLDFDLEVKALTEEGTFSGYGAVFNNVDDWGDRIMPGAFAKSLDKMAKSGIGPALLWCHDMREPLGVPTLLAEDRKGLKVDGKLVLETVRGSETYALMKAGAVTGMSIGYRTVADQVEGNVRLLKEIDLFEISLLPSRMFANDKARVTSVKASADFEDFARRLRDGEVPEIKEFEGLLRDAGIPKALAVKIASHGYAKAIRSESEGEASDEALRALREAVRAFQP